ncbi:MAG: ABC transporter substrate-binding protein, partial [Chitinophagaceae bacterium]|nr:ABC transporter substrate-binding protein [Chitinophagaceae bacterium]
MQKKSAYLIVLLIFSFATAFSQDSAEPKRLKIALFTPLYLDSAFDQSLNYKQGKIFPKYINAGLEFYEGAEMAADSLDKEGMPVDLFVFDTRSTSSGVNELVKTGALNNTDLIIGHVNANEAKQLATFATSNHIPFINANYPNDAGVTNNPDFIVLNSTLYTHCAGIYKFIQKNYQLAPVVMFRRKGAQEDRLKGYFEEIAKTASSVPLKIKYVTLADNFTVEEVKKYLDENLTTVAIAGSLDINFANNLAKSLASLYT